MAFDRGQARPIAERAVKSAQSCAVGVVVAVAAFGAAAGTASAAATGRDPQGLYLDATGTLQPDDFATLGTPAVVVDGASGNLLVHELDDAVGAAPADGSAPTWSLDRWYNSSQPSISRDIGAGWTTGLGYDVRLTFPNPNTVTLIAASQFSVTFTLQPDGTYSSSSTSYALSASGGAYSVSLVTQGRTLTFDSSGQLTNAAADGDAIRFDYTSAGGQTRLSAVYDNGARATRFSYNGSGQIIEADNPASQHGYYHYAGSMLNDVAAPSGGTSSYGYNSGGRLISIDRGTRHIVASYDAQGRVATLQDRGSQIALSYLVPQSPACDPSTAASQTDITEPNGTIASYCFDTDGHPVSATVPDHTAPALSLSDADAAYSSSDDQTLLEWAPAVDPDLVDGNPSEGVGGYNVRYRQGGGDWSEWTVTDLPRLIIDGGHVGESIDIEVSSFDGSGNTGDVQATTVTAIAYDSDTSLACSPTDDGLPADCNDGSEDEPDGGPPATLTEEPQASAKSNGPHTDTATGLARYKITVAGIWTTARLRPGSFVVGNIRDGWTLDRVEDGIKGYYFGTIRGDFQGCGWVESDLLGGGSYANNGTSNCVNVGKDLPRLGAVASEVNPVRTDGSPTHLKSNQAAGVRFCAYLSPAIDTVQIKHTCSSASKVVPYNLLKTGNYGIKWRYVVRGGGWVLVRDTEHHSAGYGNVNWWFVRRSALGRLCHRYSTPFDSVEQQCST